MHDLNSHQEIVFGIIGSGWRTEFFLRIAKELPERFKVAGVVTRTKASGKIIEDKFGTHTFRTMDDLLNVTKIDFAVVSVPWKIAPVRTKELVERGIPVLTETPPAPDLESLIELNRLTESGAKIQVAEQYHLHPLHAARIAIANSGKLGEINQVQISECHGYHGVSLMRKLLGIGFENASITATKITTPLMMGPNRDGGPVEEKVIESEQVIALFDFDGKYGIYDFTDEQYFSWIRSKRLLVRGSKGEITGMSVRYLKDFQTPVEYDLKRVNMGEYGNLEGFGLKGILAGEEWIYQNSFTPGKLSDDEIGVAACLEKMYDYTITGQDFYSLAEGSQDHYLSLMINEAVRTGEKIETKRQPWASNRKNLP
jgi:predicted dehydrogenase